MLGAFPVAFTDEAVYSLCARYAWRMAPHSHKRLGERMFGTGNALAAIDLPTRLEHLAGATPPGYPLGAEDLIYGHTLLPLYQPFQPRGRVEEAVVYMKTEGYVHGKLGLMAMRVKHPQFLRYCPRCVTEDRRELGEAYWHRTHQVSGVEVCPRHNTLLEASAIPYKNPVSRHRFVALEDLNTVSSAAPRRPSVGSSGRGGTQLRRLALDVEWLLCQRGLSFDPEDLRRAYVRALADLGLATHSGRVKVTRLTEQLYTFYAPDAAALINVYIGEGRGWVARLVNHPRVSRHPLMHLLLIQFLGLSAEEFIGRVLSPAAPFGSPPWPCLNRVCPQFHRPVILEHQASYTKDRGKPRGTFTCPVCGFSYARSGPDRSDADRHRVDRIVRFGDAWEGRLSQLWGNASVSLRELARRIGVEPKTAGMQAQRLGLPSRGRTGLKTKPAVASTPSPASGRERERYRAAWADLRRTHPEIGITELRRRDGRVYNWLYRNDRDWLRQNRPAPSRPKAKAPRVDWAARDEKLAVLAGEAVRELLRAEGRPVQVTASRIGKKMGHCSMLEKHMSRLPMTHAVVQRYAEPREAFAVRRLSWAAREFGRLGVAPRRWQLVRKAALRAELAELPVVKETLERLLGEWPAARHSA